MIGYFMYLGSFRDISLSTFICEFNELIEFSPNSTICLLRCLKLIGRSIFRMFLVMIKHYWPGLGHSVE